MEMHFLEGGVNNESMERTSRRGNLWDGLSAVVRVTNSYTSAMVYLIARLWKLIKVSGGGGGALMDQRLIAVHN